MKERKRRAPRMEDLIPDAEKRQMVLQRLYQGDALVGDGGIFTDLLQALVNAALEGELDGTLAEESEDGERNRRNGHNTKYVKSRVGPLEISTPRDRQGIHDPKLIGKWDRELSSGMDEIILSMYAHGQSIEDIRRQLHSLYGVEMSAGTISAITDRVYNEIISWQQRTLNSCYAIVYLDAIYYKIREDSKVVTKAVYTVYGVDLDGQRDILGFYLQATEGARYWGLVLEDIKKRGVEDVLFFCVDGLNGFKEVIAQVYPMSIIQRCIVHMVRTSTRFVSDKDIKAICVDLRKIYNAADRDQAAIALEAFGEKWDKKYKEIRPKWEVESNKVEIGNIKFLGAPRNQETAFWFAAWFIPYVYPTEKMYSEGVDLHIFEYARENPNAKIMRNSFKRQVADLIETHNVYELLLTSEGKITEGSRSNIFFIKGQKIYTSKAENVLKGITRKKIIGLCEKLKLELIEKEILIDELNSFEAAFLSGTSPKVLAISKILDVKSYDTNNEILKMVTFAFDDLIEAYLRAFKWN
jgi:putative transposase